MAPTTQLGFADRSKLGFADRYYLRTAQYKDIFMAVIPTRFPELLSKSPSHPTVRKVSHCLISSESLAKEDPLVFWGGWVGFWVEVVGSQFGMRRW